MPLLTVTGKVRHADGTVWALGEVKFRLTEAFETSLEVYPEELHTEILDTLGEFSVALGVPDTGTARYEITTPDNARYYVYLAAGAATNLQTILVLATSAVSQDAALTAIAAAYAAWAAVERVLVINNVSTDTLLTPSFEYVRCTGTIELTLEPATGSGVPYALKHLDANVVTITPDGTDTIGGAASLSMTHIDEYVVLLDAEAGLWDIV